MRKVNCREFQSLLDGYIDGELRGDVRQAVLSHARQCPACQRELEDAQALRDALSHLNDDVFVPVSTQAKWRSAIRREAARKKRTVFYRAVSAVAATFVLLAGVTTVFRANGLLDGLSVQAPSAETVHIQPSGQTDAYYNLSQAAGETTRVALLESDGLLADSESEAVQEPAQFAARAAQAGLEEQPEKVAYGALREMYAENFDDTHRAILGLAEEYNAAVVSDALETGAARRAVLAIDVPVEELDAFLTALDFVGEVTYSERHTEDLTERYYDAQGRLDALYAQKAQLDKLVSEAAQAQELEDLNAQTESVYAQIDELTGKINGYDSRVRYARVDVALNEGLPVATAMQDRDGADTQASKGFAASIQELGRFFSDMFVSLAVIAPYAAIVLAALAIVWIIIAVTAKRRRGE